MPLTPRRRRLLIPTSGLYFSLDWTSNTEPDLAYYRVYRSTTSGSGYTLVADRVADSSWTDTTGLVSGTTYYWIVRAVNTSGAESGNSNEVTNDAGGPTYKQSGGAADMVLTGTPLTLRIKDVAAAQPLTLSAALVAARVKRVSAAQAMTLAGTPGNPPVRVKRVSASVAMTLTPVIGTPLRIRVAAVAQAMASTAAVVWQRIKQSGAASQSTLSQNLEADEVHTYQLSTAMALTATATPTQPSTTKNVSASVAFALSSTITPTLAKRSEASQGLQTTSDAVIRKVRTAQLDASTLMSANIAAVILARRLAHEQPFVMTGSVLPTLPVTYKQSGGSAAMVLSGDAQITRANRVNPPTTELVLRWNPVPLVWKQSGGSTAMVLDGTVVIPFSGETKNSGGSGAAQLTASAQITRASRVSAADGSTLSGTVDLLRSKRLSLSQPVLMAGSVGPRKVRTAALTQAHTLSAAIAVRRARVATLAQAFVLSASASNLLVRKSSGGSTAMVLSGTTVPAEPPVYKQSGGSAAMALGAVLSGPVRKLRRAALTHAFALVPGTVQVYKSRRATLAAAMLLSGTMSGPVKKYRRAALTQPMTLSPQLGQTLLRKGSSGAAALVLVADAHPRSILPHALSTGLSMQTGVLARKIRVTSAVSGSFLSSDATITLGEPGVAIEGKVGGSIIVTRYGSGMRQTEFAASMTAVGAPEDDAPTLVGVDYKGSMVKKQPVATLGEDE